MQYRFFNRIDQNTGNNYTLAVDASKIETMDMGSTYDLNGNQLGSEYEGEEVEAVTYWDGHNWASFICDEEITDNDEKAALIEALENKEYIDTDGYGKSYKSEGFEIYMPHSPTAWQFQITEI